MFLRSLAGPADSVDGGTSHQQNPGEEQEPPEGEASAPLQDQTKTIFTITIIFLHIYGGGGGAPQHKTGLPISTYFSAVKLRWLMDNVDEVRDAVVSRRAMFGTVDSWLIWVSQRGLGTRTLKCSRRHGNP